MVELTSNQGHFVELMASDPVKAAHGFSLLAQYDQPEIFFEPLLRAGMLGASNNPEPRAVDENGSRFFVPYWPALGFMLRVAKVASDRNDYRLGDQIMGVIRDVSLEAIRNDRRTNYHTSAAFAEILGVIPPRCITVHDVELVRAWISDPWGGDLVLREVENGLLSSLLREPSEESSAKLTALVDALTGIVARDESVDAFGKMQLVADGYALKCIFDNRAAELGRVVGLQVVDLLVKRVGALFGGVSRGELSWLHRPAIEQHDQNPEWDYGRSSLVDAARDALSAWVEVDAEGSRGYVSSMLVSEDQIVRRIGLHACRVHWGALSTVFIERVNADLFVAGHIHELYLLLAQRFQEISPEHQRGVVSSIERVGANATDGGVIQKLRLEFNWLHAIKGRGNTRADARYAEIAAKYKFEMRENPDFIAYHSEFVGVGGSPFDVSELCEAARRGQLVRLVDGFVPSPADFGEPKRALLDSVSDAVKADPEIFLPLVNWEENMSRGLQYSLLAGLFDSARSAVEGGDFELFQRVSDEALLASLRLLSDELFWLETVAVSSAMEPNRDWIPGLVADFLIFLHNSDVAPVCARSFSLSGEILEVLLRRADGIEHSDDPLASAINSPRGKAVDALISMTLRLCRDGDRINGTHAAEWAALRAFFESEISGGCGARLESFAILGSHIQQLIYLDPAWVETRARDLFPVGEGFAAAVSGLGYAKPSRTLFSIISSANVFRRVVIDNSIGGATRERVLERVALAYIWGQESLDGDLFELLFSAEHAKDLLEVARTIARWARSDLTEDQKGRALGFGSAASGKAKELGPDAAELHGALAQFVAFNIPPFDHDVDWLLLSLHFTSGHHGSSEIYKSIERLSEISPGMALRFIRVVADSPAAAYDYGGALRRSISNLANAGFKPDAIEILMKMIQRTGSEGLISLYDDLVE